MSEFREIITKAVVEKDVSIQSQRIHVNRIMSQQVFLGCWVINHSYEARKNGKHVEIEGFYDVNTWYSFDGNTKDRSCNRTCKLHR